MRSSLLTFVAGFVALFAFCGVVTAVVMPYENLAARALALKNYAMRPLAVRQDVASGLLVKRGNSYVANQRRARDPAARVAIVAAVNKRDVATASILLPTSPPAAARTVSVSTEVSASAGAASGATITNRIPYPQWSTTLGGPAPSAAASGGTAGTVKMSGVSKSISYPMAESVWLGALGAAGLAVLLHFALVA